MDKYNVSVNIKEKQYNEKLVYVASIREYPDCIGQGDTPEKAYNEVMNNFSVLCEFAKETGKDLNLLKTEDEFSGRILLRLPKSLHRQLAWQAENEGVSLNTCIVNSLAQKTSHYDIVNTFEKLISNVSITIQNEDLNYNLPSSKSYVNKKWEVEYSGTVI